MDLPQSYVATKRDVNQRRGEDDKTSDAIVSARRNTRDRKLGLFRETDLHPAPLVIRRCEAPLSRRAGNGWFDACRSYDTVTLFLNDFILETTSALKSLVVRF
jgi:hypothetical protein